MDNKEKIQILRAVINVVGILVIVMALMYAIKLRETHGCDLRECVYKACDDCDEEYTGLYGNCKWISDKITYTGDYDIAGYTKVTINYTMINKSIWGEHT